jgi:hypothetical protein
MFDAGESAHHRRAVEVTEHGEGRVRIAAVAIPQVVDGRQLAGPRRGHHPALGLQVARLQVGIAAPGEQADGALMLGRQLEIRAVGGEQHGRPPGFRAVRRAEDDPEVVVDDVEGDLAAADRAFHEAHHDEVGLVEHEAVTRADRQLAKRDKRVGCCFRALRRSAAGRRTSVRRRSGRRVARGDCRR